VIISVVTLAEIRFGIEVLPDLTRRSERRASLQGVPNVRAKGSTDHGGCDAQMEALGRGGSRLVIRSRSQTSASPRHCVLMIVSRDTSDIERARVTVFNPWVEAAPRERD
jgi:toxin FitB